MNAYNMLESIIGDILEVIKPQKADWDARSRIIDELRDVAGSVESLRGATLEPYGSFLSNLFTRWGDLDISIELPNDSHISLSAKKRKRSLLGDLLRALRHKDLFAGGWQRMELIPNARVPILKLESIHHSISCDISIDNIQGQTKSKFLFWINRIDGRFREMVLLVKEWAKAQNINNPKSGTFNSYSLSLLVIFHFQTCVPPILPPLKELYPRNVVDDLTGPREYAEKHIAEICGANIRRIMSDKFRPINQSSMSELFTSFLAKFSDINLKAKNLGICPFTGQWEDIGSNMRWMPRTYAVFVEDPFEQPENTARTVNAGRLTWIATAFRTSHHQLIRNQAPRFVLSTLVSGQAFEEVASTSARYQSYPGWRHSATQSPLQSQVASTSIRYQSYPGWQHSATQSQFQRPVRSPSQVQHHPRDKAEGSQNNGTQRKPVQLQKPRGQQMWRPKSNESKAS